MPDRVLHVVQAEQPVRKRRNIFMSRLAAPLPLVAIFIVIALVVAIFVGGRLVHDWQTVQRGTPAGHSAPTFQDQLAALEQRPVNLPTVQAGDPCPTSANTVAPNLNYR